MEFGPQHQLHQQPNQKLDQRPVLSKKMIASLNVLVKSSQELQEDFAQKAAENPALEIDENQCCLHCGMPLRESFCPNCGANPTASRLQEPADWGEAHEHSLIGGDDDEFDPMTRVSTGETLEDTLLTALRSLLPPQEIRIAEALIGNLNDHGYLDCSTEAIAEDLDVPVDAVEMVLDLLQGQEPIGIGARDLRECLLIQLRWFREQGDPQPLAEQIVDGFLREVAERRFIEIGRELGTTSRHVRQAWDFMKANLNPFPGHEAPNGPIIRNSSNRGATALVRPDVIIRRTETGFEAEIVEGRRFQLRVNATYQAILRQGGAISDAERRHIHHYVNQAQFFIDCVRQRWDTLNRIANALIEVQYDFLDRGVRYLKPLTRSELAHFVDLHEATISRATNEKYVLLPNGRTIPFDDFFNASLRAKDTLRELIGAENPRKPLSDEDLAELLRERGMIVARRTVAKYREALKILPSRLR